MQAGFRKKENFIHKLQHEDQVVTSQEDKQDIMFNYFEGLLGMEFAWPSALNLDFFNIEGIDLSALDASIMEDEVWDTIKSLPANRAPGPDGYTCRFYKSCWLLIKADFMAAISSLSNKITQENCGF